MFFFIAGVGPRRVVLRQEPRTCPNCGHVSLRLQRIDQYVSLFFIPFFPVKKGQPFLSCESCGAAYDEQGKPMFRDQKSRDQVCRQCGRIYQPDFSYCPYCGAPSNIGKSQM